MGCAIQIVKYLVFIANFVFALCGIALLTVGILYKLDINAFTDAIPKDYQNVGLAPVFTIVVGSIIFVIAFFGCCGAIKENICCLNTYAGILIAILVLQIAIAVLAFLSIKNSDSDIQLDKEIEKELDRIFGKYPQAEAVEVIDTLQSELKCCGVNGPQYWLGKPKIPGTCCGKPSNESCMLIESYLKGCSSALYDFITKAMHVIGYVVIGIAVTEVVGVIFALCLASSVRNHMRRGGYA